MRSGLRLYGHPALLTIAASINGDDFVPYNDATFVKQPGVGGSVAWHQDGVTHWDSEDWDEGIHGFNFQVQLCDTSAKSCLWVVPGTHKEGRIDIKARVAANGGSEWLPDAVPLYCSAGDVTIVNRQALHCSFANTSPDMRVSLTFGFHRRNAVLGARGALSQQGEDVYDEARIFERSRVIAVAIDARAQYYPDEASFTYEPFAGLEDDYRFNDATGESVILDYNLKDLSILDWYADPSRLVPTWTPTHYLQPLAGRRHWLRPCQPSMAGRLWLAARRDLACVCRECDGVGEQAPQLDQTLPAKTHRRRILHPRRIARCGQKGRLPSP